MFASPTGLRKTKQLISRGALPATPTQGIKWTLVREDDDSVF